MSTHKDTQSNPDRKATRDDVQHVIGSVDDTLVVEILSNQPTYRELTDAALWARGDGDLTAREHRELSAAALAVAEILTREEDEAAPGEDA